MTSNGRPRSRRTRAVLLVAVSAASAAAWAAIRIPTARGIHGWSAGNCARFAMQPTDAPCQLPLGRTVAVYLAASAFVTLAVLVPALVLAMRGRRLSAYIPMLLPAAVVLLARLATWYWSGFWAPVDAQTTPSPIFLGPWAPWSAMTAVPSPWTPDHPVAILVDLAIVAAPVAAYQLLFRPARVARSELRWSSIVLACAVAAGASGIVELGSHAVADGGSFVEGGWYLQGLLLMSFGLLLPLGPRRPLWAIPPVAICASLGPAAALAGSLQGWTGFTWFRAAVPLALIGAAGAGSIWFVARQRDVVHVSPWRGRRVRPVAFAHAAGLGALAVSFVMVALDPLPAQISTVLPTYLGARERVDDLRTRMTLDRAAEAVRAFRDRSGSFAGFGVQDGEAAAGELLWSDELPAPDTSSEPELWVRIAGSTERRVELVLAGPVTTYCLRIGDGGGSTFGAALQGQESDRVRSAIARCGDDAWTDDLLRPFPVDGLCAGVVEPSITICRAVQELLRERLASPTGVT